MVRRVLTALVVLVIGVGVSALTVPVGAEGHATTIASFDDSVAPEGIAVGDDGTVYVSTAGGGQIWALAPGDPEPSVVATIDPAISPAAFGVLGLWIDGGTLYAAAATGNPDTHGIWAVDLAAGTTVRLPGSESAALPNAVVVADGVVYFTDSIVGGVWRQQGTTPAEPWLVDETLAGTGAIVGPDAPIGANGIAHSTGTIFVANTEKGSLVAVPIEPDGSAGAAQVVAADPALAGIDGVVADHDGTIYGVVVLSASLVTIGPDGSVTPVAGLEDGLDVPSSVDVGPDGFVYVVNFSIGEAFGLPGDAGPGVVRVDPSAAVLGDRDIVAYSAGNQEVPGTSSSAWAWSVFRLRADRGTMAFSTTVFGIESPIVAAHLHWAPRGENGPVVVDLSDAIVDDTRLDGVVSTGSLTGVLDGATLGDLVAEIDAGRIYLNIHTADEPAGEIRGQLIG